MDKERQRARFGPDTGVLVMDDVHVSSIDCPCCGNQIDVSHGKFHMVMLNRQLSLASDIIVMERSLAELRSNKQPKPAELKAALELDAKLIKARGHLKKLNEISEETDNG